MSPVTPFFGIMVCTSDVDSYNAIVDVIPKEGLAMLVPSKKVFTFAHNVSVMFMACIFCYDVALATSVCQMSFVYFMEVKGHSPYLVVKGS